VSDPLNSEGFHLNTPNTHTAPANADSKAMRGVLSPVLTPFHADLSVHKELLAAQCHWLLKCNVGLAVFGTNSEGNSLSVGERSDLVQYLVAQGVDPRRMMPGTGGCALPDVVSLTQACLRAGVQDVLVLPPFYYKGVSDEGLFSFFSELIERVGDKNLRVYLYHIPPVSQIGFSMDLIEKLINRYGSVIAGAKDSGGQWANTAAMIERFSHRGFSVFAGSENFLMRTLRAGGAGCISATANVNPAAISSLCSNWMATDADAQQHRLDVVRALFAAFPMIPAMKAAVAQVTGKSDWKRVRPPLISLDPTQELALLNSMKEAGFEMKI
jgi:4-hydroxy-tetrahydrodipicolinate synthase